MARKTDPGSPFAGVDSYDITTVASIQAIYRTSEGKRALEHVINVLAGTYDQSYRPGSERDSAFAEGRRFVGLQLVKLVKLNMQLLKEKHGNRDSNRDPDRDPASESGA